MSLKIRDRLLCVIAFIFITLLGVICTVAFTQEKQTAFALEAESGNFRVYNGGGVFYNGYDDIVSAWDAAKSLSFEQVNDDIKTATVKMYEDAAVTDTLEINSANYTVALDLNGHKLSVSSEGKSVIYSSGTFTLQDSNPAAANSVTSYAGGNTPQTVDISGGVITGAKGYAAVNINSGKFNMQGGTVAGNVITSKWGAAVKPGAVFTMTGGAITENLNTAGGAGGIHVQGVSVKLSGAIKIDGNSSCTDINGSERIECNFGFDYNAKIVVNGALNDGAVNNARIGLTLMDDYALYGAKISKDYSVYHEGEAADKYFYSDNFQKCPKVSGGEVCFFNHDFGSSDYTVEGDKHSRICKTCKIKVASYHSYSASDGKCVCSAQAAASVGTSFYADFGQAWAAANEAGTATIKMFDDASITDNLKISDIESRVITLDLNGRIISGVNGRTAIYVNGKTNKFTLKDSAGGGKIMGAARGIYIENDATVNMEGGEISGNVVGGVYISVGTFNLSGGKILGNTARNGGGVYLSTGTFNMSGGEISGNTSSENGGGVFVGIGTTFNMSGGTIKENTAQKACGGVYVTNGSKFNVSGLAQIFGNTVGDKARNVLMTSTAKIIVAGKLSQNATIGVYMESAGNVATGYSQSESPSSYFTSDNDQLNCIYNDNGTVKFAAHDFGNWEITLKPTCSAQGSKRRICTACDHVETEETEIDENAHSWGEWTESKPADCTNKGEETRVCVHNSEHKETQETDALGHTWSSESVRIEPTCTADGSITGTCTVCGKKDVEVLDKLGHNIEQHEAQAATCTEKGWNAYETCSRCDHTTYAEISALGHDLKHIDRVEATVTADGHIEHWICSVCEKKYSDGNGATEVDSVIIPMLKAELVKPDENGGEHNVIVTTPEGFAHDIDLVVTEIEKENYAQYESIAQTLNGKIALIYDVTLESDGVTVRPDGTLTVKLRIPENLQGKNFKLFHLHGSEATDMEYTIDGSYAVITTDKLSVFIFVVDKVAPKDGLSAGAIAGITIAAIVTVLLAVYIALYFILYRKGVVKGKAFDVIYTPMSAIFNKKNKSE